MTLDEKIKEEEEYSQQVENKVLLFPKLDKILLKQNKRQERKSSKARKLNRIHEGNELLQTKAVNELVIKEKA